MNAFNGTQLIMLLYLALALNSLSAKSLADEFDAAPSWIEMTNENIKREGVSLITVIDKLKYLSEGEISNILQNVLARHPMGSREWIETASKIHVFNRVYFAVPKHRRLKESRRFTIFFTPISEKGEDMLYPLKKDGNVFEIHGLFLGVGGAASPMLEFAFFSKTYGKRIGR